MRCGVDESAAKRIADRLMKREEVKEAIRAAMDAREKRAEINSDEILRSWWQQFNADVTDIVEHWRVACPNCYGEGIESYRGKFADPDEKCKFCNGQGESRLLVKDTRKMTKGAKLMIQSIKIDKAGAVNVTLQNRDKVAEMLARHLGLFNDKLELSGDVAHVVMIDV